MLPRGEAVGGTHGEAGLRLAHQPGDADHEELVEVRGEDRAELDALEQRERLVGGEVEHPGVELDPRQLAVEEARLGGERRLGTGSDPLRTVATLFVASQCLDQQALEVGDQALRLGQEVAVAEHSRAHPPLHAFDEAAVLGADLVVESSMSAIHCPSASGREEVVEEPIGALRPEGAHRPDRDVPAARHDVDGRTGEEEVELASLDLAARVVDAAAAVLRRPVLARERRMLLERVGAGATSIAFEKLGCATAQW